jgi:hypothetical protein
MKIEKHDDLILYLDNNWLQKGVNMWNPNRLTKQFGDLKKWLEKIFANPQRCPNCGGLKYDVVIKHGGIEFHFGLWKIMDKRNEGEDKIIAETDYKKLSRYAKRMSFERARAS